MTLKCAPQGFWIRRLLFDEQNNGTESLIFDDISEDPRVGSYYLIILQPLVSDICGRRLWYPLGLFPSRNCFTVLHELGW